MKWTQTLSMPVLAAAGIVLSCVLATGQEAEQGSLQERREAARTEVRRIYEARYALKKRADRAALARDLLAKGSAEDYPDDALRFALLDEARSLAMEVHAIPTVAEAVRLLASIGGGGFADLAVDTLVGMERSPAEAREDLLRFACEAIEASVAEERLNAALAVLDAKCVRLAARETKKDGPLRDQIARLRAQEDVWKKVVAGLATLETDAMDPGARLTVGRYRLFERDDLEGGAPLLVGASDERLSTLAALELEPPADAPTRRRAADGWYEWSLAATGREREWALRRASYWYSLVRDEASDVERLELDFRLDEIARANAALAQTPSQALESAAAPEDGADGAMGKEAREAPELSWAKIERQDPDPKVVTNPALRESIRASGLPWHVRHRVSQVAMFLVPLSDESFLYVGKYEVRYGEWYRVLESRGSEAADLPVGGVARSAIDEFLRRAGGGLRLPTEKEWEEACRAGTAGDRYGDVDAIAWHQGNSGGTAHPVGQKPANALGLHDMLGNVHEWCDGRYFRGGSWRHPAENSTVGFRLPPPTTKSPEDPGPAVGFRVVRDAK